jgi:RNA polymerase sigma-70 factor (ECF subfamily)
MDPAWPSSTSPTLLGRVCQSPADSTSWADFVHRYGPRIYRWCRQWHLTDADAQDVTQNVLLKLFTRLPTFAYDPRRSFRAWLKTVTHHAWRDYLDSFRRQGRAGTDTAVFQMLDRLEARDDLVKHLEEEFDRELLAEATVRVKARVAPHTWEAFHLLTHEGLPTAVVAERTGMQPATVLVAKSKVIKMLREEIAALEGGESPSSPDQGSGEANQSP